MSDTAARSAGLPAVKCIGDSIRMGYEPTVIAELQGVANVLAMNDTQGGNTRNVLSHLDEWVIGPQPTLVHLNAGLHDLIRAVGPGPTTAVPVDEYERNLRQIFTRIRQATRATLIFALTTPVNLDRQRAVNYGINRINEDVILYNAAARAAAAEFSVPINDLYQVVMDHDVDAMLGPDGVHYSDFGKTTLGGYVANVIRRHLPPQ